MNYWYWLANIPGIGTQKQYALLHLFGKPENIFDVSKEQLLKCKEISEKDAEMISLYRRNTKKVEEDYLKMEKDDIQFIELTSPQYPTKLKQCYRPPIGIYCKGKLPHEAKKTVAVVGARMCSPYGKAIATEIGKELARHGVNVVSGMARGIDGYAHEGAIEAKGYTYAILAGGVNMIYPPEHRNLYEEIITHGGVISEYKPDTAPNRGMFPLRNRIISGISDAVVLVEAREKSGSLITADFALEQGKDIFVVPGKISDSLSAGCNQYIKQGAEILTSVEDLILSLGVKETVSGAKVEKEKIPLEKEESLVYSCLRLTPQSLDELSETTGIGLMKMMEILSKLREKGLAEEYYINQFIRSA